MIYSEIHFFMSLSSLRWKTHSSVNHSENEVEEVEKIGNN